MYNLSSHKRSEVREAIKTMGAELWYLPPYSPDLNPIEQAFSKFKWLIKSEDERTVSSHIRAILEVRHDVDSTAYSNSAGWDRRLSSTYRIDPVAVLASQ